MIVATNTVLDGDEADTGDDVTATVFVLLSPVSAEAMLAADSAAVKQPVISES